MKNRSSYDKIFEKVWGASGGWAVVMCPCGVVYSITCNLRAESPRDYADMLLSWKHFPNIAIYDFARGLATHTNLREPENLPFSPHEGRLAEATADNLQLAAEGRLKVSLPWLKTKKTGHPITGSSDHYTLYDGFHERNTKDAKDALRRIALVPELAGWVNSQCAEQLFSDMRKNNYFLNTLTPSEHIFMMRNMLHHYNTKCNNKTKTSIQKVVGRDVQLQLDHNGQIVIGTAAQIATETDETTQSGE
ncbi:HMG domain-containing protein 3-like [Triplophysa rosa]|uniref:HMG domain-containing protein 3-like n=1 Tax=Triplophysa rosa TaxID=992332 RepID=UPI002545F508|nr:HMG domain-containing protein 3-like [Triplophysa rosa]